MSDDLPPEWFVITRVFARDEREARLVAAVIGDESSDVQVIRAAEGDEEE